MIYRANIGDLVFVCNALRANGDLEQASEEQIAHALHNGQIEFYILRQSDSVTGVGVLRGEGEATLVAFYREGPARGLLHDASNGLKQVTETLRNFGIDKIGADVHLTNPLYFKLLKFYRRLGFRPRTTRLTWQV